MSLISGTGWFARYLDVDAQNDPLVVFRPVIAFVERSGSSGEIYGVVTSPDNRTIRADQLSGFDGYVTTQDKEKQTMWGPLKKKKLEETRRA